MEYKNSPRQSTVKKSAGEYEINMNKNSQQAKKAPIIIPDDGLCDPVEEKPFHLLSIFNAPQVKIENDHEIIRTVVLASLFFVMSAVFMIDGIELMIFWENGSITELISANKNENKQTIKYKNDNEINKINCMFSFLLLQGIFMLNSSVIKDR